MLRKKLKSFVKLPRFTITDIYDNRVSVNYAMMPVGVAFDWLKSLPFITGRNNETDDDRYKNCFLKSVDIVDTTRLPIGQRNRLNRAGFLNNENLYLGTIYEDLPGNKLKQRQIFLKESGLAKLGITSPKAESRFFLLDKMATFTINGQYWGWSRPRCVDVETTVVSQEVLNYLETKLNDPKTRIQYSPLPFFAAPVKMVYAVCVLPLLKAAL